MSLDVSSSFLEMEDFFICWFVPDSTVIGMEAAILPFSLDQRYLSR